MFGPLDMFGPYMSLPDTLGSLQQNPPKNTYPNFNQKKQPSKPAADEGPYHIIGATI